MTNTVTLCFGVSQASVAGMCLELSHSMEKARLNVMCSAHRCRFHTILQLISGQRASANPASSFPHRSGDHGCIARCLGFLPSGEEARSSRPH